MYKTLLALSLAGALLCACKPTERTATARTQQQDSKQPAQAPAPQAPQNLPEPAAEPTAAATPGTSAAAATTENPEQALLVVNLTRQGYNRLTPWEKQPPSQRRVVGTYLGNGLVLTHSSALLNATYAELSLPDSTRTVPARVLRYDNDLGLGLLGVVHETDASIFDTRTAPPLGHPLSRGDKAELWCTLNGTEPLRIPLQAQVGTADAGMPRLSMQAELAVPDTFTYGAPVIQDGKLVGMSAGYESNGRKLTIINAELLQRFLEQTDSSPRGVPTVGLEIATLDDPVFRRYLKLPEGSTGIYVSKVTPHSAAAAAGICKGDVITAIEGMPVDNLGRCNLPLYGMSPVGVAMRYLKPLGRELNLTISRNGESMDIAVSLNKDARDKALLATEPPDAAPRYLVWGGLVFQPLTDTYLQNLKSQARGSLPVEFLELETRENELRERGYSELTALTLVIPTPTTLGYDSLGFSLVEKVNGKEVHTFADFARALDEPTADGTVELSINKAPYRIYLDRAAAETTNDSLRRSSVPVLRRLEKAAPEPQP